MGDTKEKETSTTAYQCDFDWCCNDMQWGKSPQVRCYLCLAFHRLKEKKGGKR